MTPLARHLTAVFVALAAALMSALISGCRGTKPCCLPATAVAPCSYETTTPTPDTPDLEPLVPLYETSPGDVPTRLPRPIDDHLALDPAQCQCNAATNAPLVGAMQLERHWAGVLACCESGAAEQAFCLTRALLAYQVADRQNDAAAGALQAFYALAGVEAQQRWLDQGMFELETTVGRLDALRKRGLPTPDAIDRDRFAAQLDAMRDQQLELDLLRGQLNGQLRRLLGCPLQSDQPFWPEVDWAVDLDPIDTEIEIATELATGLATRADLRALRRMRCGLSESTLPVAREVLSTADPTLGGVTLPPGPLHKLRCATCDDHELAIRRRQLALVEAEATKQATAEILAAAGKLESAQQRVRLARRAVDDRQRELEAIQKRRETQGLSIFTVSASRGRLIEAQTKLVEQVVELKLARVELRQATGMLAAECGR